MSIVRYSKATEISNINDPLVRDNGTAIGIFDIEQHKKLLGTFYDPIKELKEYYVKKIETLEAKIEELQDNIVKLPPRPLPPQPKPKTTGELYNYFLGTTSYSTSYSICEININNLDRMKIIAFLSVIKDFGISNEPLSHTIEEYNSSARENIDLKIKMFSEAAKEKNLTLVRFVNLQK